MKIILALTALLVLPAAAAELPAHWFGSDESSKVSLQYDDVDQVLNSLVLMSGPPNRKKSKASGSSVSTRLKNNYNVLTTNAGNRIAYEELRKKPAMQAAIHKIRLSLEAVPAEVDLNTLSKKEQLAYWLNLYNMVVIDEISKVYPKKNLQDFVLGADGLLARKTMHIEGVALSLADIQYKVVQAQYPDDVLLIYGFYQGYIGSPSIRKHAYTAANLYRALQFNAHEFINSNRGTYPAGKTFRVAGFYQRHAAYFPDFEQDLKAHLKEYLRESEQQELTDAGALLADIHDWTVTDIFGTSRNYGGAAATNEAALLGAFAQREGSGEVANTELMANVSLDKAVSYGRFSAEQVTKLKEMKFNHINRGGSVTVTDLDSSAAPADKNKQP